MRPTLAALPSGRVGELLFLVDQFVGQPTPLLLRKVEPDTRGVSTSSFPVRQRHDPVGNVRQRDNTIASDLHLGTHRRPPQPHPHTLPLDPPHLPIQLLPRPSGSRECPLDQGILRMFAKKRDEITDVLSRSLAGSLHLRRLIVDHQRTRQGPPYAPAPGKATQNSRSKQSERDHDKRCCHPTRT